MSDTITRPAPARVGPRAAEILAAMKAHPSFERLTGSSMKYSPCWATFTGYPTISRWDLDRDNEPLLTEALKVLAIKAAVYEITDGDERAAEILVADPVDEMIHAVLAQFTVVSKMQTDLGVQFPHATELESYTYTRGCETDDYYAAAGFGEQPLRYWLDSREVARRLEVLNGLYGSVGFTRDGRGHDIDFDATAPEYAAA